MICEYTVKKFCKDDISLIENYDKAIYDNDQTWHCHHRKENISSKKELLEKNEYFNRPAEELIFLTPSEHIILHNKGKQYMLGKLHSDETKRKISETLKGHKLSEETKLKISDTIKGTKLSEETKQKLSKASKGRCWFNNGIKNVFVRECPEGFVKGMIIKKSV